jgi:hypothetical protein
MEILSLNYGGSKVLYLLSLGAHNGKMYGIELTSIPTTERNEIINNLAALSSFDLKKKASWFKTKCPISYKQGFRSLNQSLITIIAKYPISKLKS